jgi:hypothetical protein
MDQKIEWCSKCGMGTGHGSPGNDSLYVNHTGPFCEDCYQALKPTAPAVPQGWKLVPIEPTIEMMMQMPGSADATEWKQYYKAMLSMAPIAPAQQAWPKETQPDGSVNEVEPSDMAPTAPAAAVEKEKAVYKVTVVTNDNLNLLVVATEYTMKDAQASAERLANMNPGIRYAVTQMLGIVRAGGVVWE